MKKLRVNLFIIGYSLVLMLMAGLGLFFANYESDRSRLDANGSSYYDLPRITLSLTTAGISKNGKVRMDVALEVAKKDRVMLDDFKPRIMDAMIGYMQAYDADEAIPVSSMQELHDNLLYQVKRVSQPVPIRNLVFKNFVVQ